MTGIVLVLVILSSILHAIWNLIAKKVSGGLHFAWILWFFSTLLLTPFAIRDFAHGDFRITWFPLVIICMSSLLHAGYFLMLQKSYKYGDLSIVYPVTRGLGPLISVILAIVILHERPTLVAISGTVVITIGIFLLAGKMKMFNGRETRISFLYSFITSLFIGGYLIADKYAVGIAMVSPIFFSWSYELGRTLILLPSIFKSLDKISYEIKVHFKECVFMAFLGTSSYLLILFAFQYAPLSYIAPARTLGIVFGTILGGILLKEEEISKRIFASCVIVTGLVLLSIG